MKVLLDTHAVIGAGAALHEPESFGDMKFLMIGLIIPGGICLLSIPFEIRRARNVLDELEGTLSQ